MSRRVGAGPYLDRVYHAWVAADWRYSAPPDSVPSSPPLPTGIADLDHVVGGLRPGHMWVLTGHSGSGKSVLAAQLAAQVALDQDVTVVLASLRDPPRLTWDRMVSATSQVPLPGPAWPGTPGRNSGETLKRELAEDRLRRCRLWLTHQADEVPVHKWVDDGALATARLLVVDDVHHPTRRADPTWLTAWAKAHQATVIVTTVPEVVYDPDPRAPWGVRVRPPWRGHIDLLAELRWPDQPDQDGAVRLAVLRHRWGPVAAIDLAFVGWQARFIGVAT